jgi:hypothetical protein
LHNSIKTGNGIYPFHCERNVSIISGNQTRLPSPAAIRLSADWSSGTTGGNFNCTINPQQVYEPNHQQYTYLIGFDHVIGSIPIRSYGFTESLQEIRKPCGVFEDQSGELPETSQFPRSRLQGLYSSFLNPFFGQAGGASGFKRDFSERASESSPKPYQSGPARFESGLFLNALNI